MKGSEKTYLILTHHHSDHVFGMKIFKEKGAEIIAHKKVAEELRSDDGFYKKFITDQMGWNSEYEGTSPATQFGGTSEWKIWISHLERLKKLDLLRIIPGNGKICLPDAIDRNINFLKEKIENQKVLHRKSSCLNLSSTGNGFFDKESM